MIFFCRFVDLVIDGRSKEWIESKKKLIKNVTHNNDYKDMDTFLYTEVLLPKHASHKYHRKNESRTTFPRAVSSTPLVRRFQTEILFEKILNNFILLS